jgi:redox-sensitive bicupin YhaK (pirin superfamily)
MNSTKTIVSIQPLAFPWDCLDPFLFCVHHADRFPAGDGKLAPSVPLTGRHLGEDFSGKDGWSMYHGRKVPGFPAHPHRGFEVITGTLKGLIDHSDSLGGAARYGEGDVQWLTAGEGIQHTEMFPLLNTSGPNPTEFFQIWLNLPARSKFSKPHFSMFWAGQIPKVKPAPGVEVTLMTGGLQGATPPQPPPDSWAGVKDSEVAVWVLKLAPGARWTLPAASAGLSRALYYYQGGSLNINEQEVHSGNRLVLKSDTEAVLANGPEGSALLMLQGRPIGEPLAMQGPFVMNTRAELQQAFMDYYQTQFGGWPWPSSDPVHPATEGRFARHPDGRLEHPK